MNVNALSLRDLEYVVAVARFGHFSRAASYCHISQPALSNQVKKVEDILGVKIFERTNRKVLVSQVGETIVKQANLILEEAFKLSELSNLGSKPLTGKLKVGSIATLGPYYIPYLLSPLKKSFPNLALLLKEGMTGDLISELRQGSLDLVLASPTFDSHGLKRIDLFNEPFLLAVPKKHKLADKAPLRLTDLHSEEMVLLADGHCLKDQTLKLCKTSRDNSSQELHATGVETLRHLVALGWGYTILPLLATLGNLSLRDLISYREISGKETYRTIALFCREEFSRMKDVDAVVNVIQKNLPKGVLKL
jgi:LysR family hydrogen peroxide-inducible transcriptional activator